MTHACLCLSSGNHMVKQRTRTDVPIDWRSSLGAGIVQQLHGVCYFGELGVLSGFGCS